MASGMSHAMPTIAVPMAMKPKPPARRIDTSAKWRMRSMATG
jgi:hypothetical protein